MGHRTDQELIDLIKITIKQSNKEKYSFSKALKQICYKFKKLLRIYSMQRITRTTTREDIFNSYEVFKILWITHKELFTHSFRKGDCPGYGDLIKIQELKNPIKRNVANTTRYMERKEYRERIYANKNRYKLYVREQNNV